MKQASGDDGVGARRYSSRPSSSNTLSFHVGPLRSAVSQASLPVGQGGGDLVVAPPTNGKKKPAVPVTPATLALPGPSTDTQRSAQSSSLASHTTRQPSQRGGGGAELRQPGLSRESVAIATAAFRASRKAHLSPSSARRKSKPSDGAADVSSSARTASAPTSSQNAMRLTLWPASLSSHEQPRDPRTIKSAAELAARISGLARSCQGHRADLDTIARVVADAETAIARTTDKAFDDGVRPGGVTDSVIETERVAPLRALEGMWADVTASAERTAASLSGEHDGILDDLRHFVEKESFALEHAAREAEATNAAIAVYRRRYNIVHDRQAGGAAAVHGLHDTKERFDGLDRATRQLQQDVRSYQAELDRVRSSSASSIANAEAAVKSAEDRVAVMTQSLRERCDELDFARSAEGSLRFRINLEETRRKEIEADIEHWRAKLESGKVDHNEALTPRPAWISLDVAPWGVPLRHRQAGSDSEETPSSASDNNDDDDDNAVLDPRQLAAAAAAAAASGGGEGRHVRITFEPSASPPPPASGKRGNKRRGNRNTHAARRAARSRLLSCRDGGGAGFASPLTISTDTALDIIAERLRYQTRLGREFTAEANTFRKHTSMFLTNHAPAAFTFSISGMATLLPSKSELTAIRDSNGIVLPAALWSSDRLAAIAFNIARGLQRFLGRNPVEDDVLAAVTELIEAHSPDHHGADSRLLGGMGASSRAPGSTAGSRRPSVLSTTSGGGDDSSTSRRGSVMSLGDGASPARRGSHMHGRLANAARSVRGTLGVLATFSTNRDPMEPLLQSWTHIAHGLAEGVANNTSSLEVAVPTTGAGASSSNNLPRIRIPVGVDTARSLLSQCRAQLARTTADSNPLAYGLEEALQGRLSPRLFAQLFTVIEAVVRMFGTLDVQDRKTGSLPLALVEAAVRRGLQDAHFAPAVAARASVAVMRSPAAGRVVVDTPSLMHPLASTIMYSLIEEQRRLHAAVLRILAACAYHSPPELRGAADTSGGAQTVVWLYPAELHAQLTLAKGLPKTPANLPHIAEQRAAIATATDAAAHQDEFVAFGASPTDLHSTMEARQDAPFGQPPDRGPSSRSPSPRRPHHGNANALPPLSGRHLAPAGGGAAGTTSSPSNSAISGDSEAASPPLVRASVGLLLEHLLSQLEHTRRLGDVFPAAITHEDDDDGGDRAGRGRRRRRTEFNAAALRRFQHTQMEGGTTTTEATSRQHAADSAVIAGQTEKARGRSILPSPGTIRTIVGSWAHDDPDAGLPDDADEMRLVDAAEVAARARGLCLRQYIIGTVAV